MKSGPATRQAAEPGGVRFNVLCILTCGYSKTFLITHEALKVIGRYNHKLYNMLTVLELQTCDGEK